MKFYKFEGAGNDFIITENLNNLDVINLCDRHYGIGADGVIVIDNIEDNMASIKIYNSDGSEAKTCGNGLRCVASYLKNIIGKEITCIKTICDVYNVKYLENNEYEVGFPVVNDIKKENNYYVVNSGNLHVFTINETNLDDFTNKIRYIYDSNVEVVEILDKNTIKINVNERGVGETLACGSACIAIVSALYKDNLVKDEVVCLMKGGKLKVRIKDKAYLSGKARLVYKGEFYA